MENIKINFYVMLSNGDYVDTCDSMQSAIIVCDAAGPGSYVECDGMEEILYTA